MKKTSTLSVLVLLITGTMYAQSVDTSIRSAAKNDNLVILGKVWGFLKYYHPNIAGGKYDWDQELIRFLPGYSTIKSKNERSDSLLAWLNKFGEVPACSTCNDSLLKNAKLTPGFAWINETNFSKELAGRLKYIQQNRIQKGQYYILAQSFDGINFIMPQHEASFNSITFPSDAYGLLSVFRFWNAIEYWYPYKYNLPIKWDDVLKHFTSKMLQHKDQQQYVLTVEELITAIHDSHGFFRSAKTEELVGKYYMPFTVKIIEQKVFVTSILNDSLARLSGIQKGDIIESIDSIPVNMVLKKMTPYCPASNAASLVIKLQTWITRTGRQQNVLLVKRGTQKITTSTYNFIPKGFAPIGLNPPYFTFQKDSSFCIIRNDIGYINVGNFKRNDSAALKTLVARTKALIIDNRQNQDEQNGTGGSDIIGSMVIPPGNNFVKFTMPQPSYPGVYSFSKPTNMNLENTDYYKGKIVILANENTMSVGEINTMAFQKAPKAKVMGTTTAGADGNVTYIMLPGGIYVQYTGLGVYYPNGKETQRVGIQPDIVVKQTIAGYQNNKDEQLEKAVEYLSSPK